MMDRLRILFSFIYQITIGSMQNNSNVLDESCEASSTTIGKTKINFLQAEKTRLEVIVRQLEEQIKLQKHINKELAKGVDISSNEMTQSLVTQAQILEQHYLRIKNENQELASVLLIQQQLKDESEIEFANSFKSYEEKIIELRRAIQLKENSIQSLECKLKLSDDKVITSSSNVTLLFFSEIEQLKKTISTLSLRNKQLENDNKILKVKNEQLAKKMQLLESLALKSQLTYEEFKHFYNYDNNKTRSSAPKKGVYVPLEERLNSMLSMKKLNEAQTTRECSEYASLAKDSSIKMLVYKYVLEIEKLKESLEKKKEMEKYERKAKHLLAKSYNQLQAKMNHTHTELDYYKRSTQDLIKIITYKRQLFPSKSLEKSKEERIINSIATPQEISYVTDRKKYWLAIQSTLRIQKIRLLQVKRKYNRMRRSLSCLIDYKRLQVDEVDKYLNKKSSNKQHLASLASKKVENASNDFSLMIEAPFSEDFSIIQPHCSKKSYSQWKKSNQKRNEFNLTVIQENIL